MIERIYIDNFRCFENFELDFADRKSALIIGKNGSGKSALRKAFGIFQAISRGPNHAAEWVDASDFARHRTDVPMHFEVAIVLREKKYQYKILFEHSADTNETQILEERLFVDGNPLIMRHRHQVTVPGGATFYLKQNVGALPIINERPGEDSVQQLKSFLASMIILAPAPKGMTGFTEEESFVIQEDGSNSAAWLNAMLVRYPARYTEIVEYLQFVLPDFAALEFVQRGERGKQLFVTFQQVIDGAKRAIKLDFKKLSDGEKCYFLSALILAFNREESPVFCFWDEPDHHLALPEIGHFITALRRMTNQNGQFIATTHNAEVIHRFSDENTIVLTRESHLKPTVPLPLSGLSYNGDLINAILRGEVIG